MTKIDMDIRAERVVPHNIEAEQALLGALLKNNRAAESISFLEPEHFHEPLHRKIFEVISTFIAAGKTANPVLIKPFLPADDKVGDMTVAHYLARLAAEAVTVINAKEYGEGIHEMWIRRQAIMECEGVVRIAYDLAPESDILAELGGFEDRITGLRAQRVKSDGLGIGQRYLESMTASNQRGSILGVPICLPEIGEVISEPCFEAGNLYGLLSSSGEGKTSLTVQMIGHALRLGHPVQFLSYDQSSDQCARQMVAQEYGIEARRQRNARLLSEKEWEKVHEFGMWIDRQPFEVIKCTDQGAPQLLGFARTFVKRRQNGKVPLIVVDHIGSVKPEDRRADEGTKAKDINKIFKAGAEQTGSAWLVLNQRNSFGMRRDNPRPISMDLFGGDPAKQAYDAIMYLYRPEKFKAERIAIAASDADWKKINKVFPAECEGIAEIGAIKVRFGNPNITKTLKFEDRFTRYVSERVTDQPSMLEELP